MENLLKRVNEMIQIQVGFNLLSSPAIIQKGGIKLIQFYTNDNPQAVFTLYVIRGILKAI